jgi:hypothetical protein
MSDEGDEPRRDSDADGEDDGFDFLDDSATEVEDSADVDDPFAELGADTEGDASEEPGADGPEEPGADGSAVGEFDVTDSGTVPSDADSDAGGPGLDPSSVGSDSDAQRDDPFDELGPADSEADLDDAFERMDVGGAADEDVWESLDEDDVGPAVGTDDATSVPGEDDTEHVVAKRTYCQQCPHFTPPPEVACTHEGTSILESVGFDEFRVRNCPMISEEDPTFDGDE